MSIGVYLHPPSLTAEQYDEINRRLEAAGERRPKGLQFHSCFGESGSLSVYDVWESQQDFEAFGAKLMPILSDLGIDGGKPDVVPMYDMFIP
jgi:hypothetical protein